jgi:K+-sensing histidine kinase KdpD
MTTTILKVSRSSAGREAMLRALREAGLGVVEVDDWEEARERLARASSAVLVCDTAGVDADPSALARAVAATGSEADARTEVPTDALRSLSHDLRTPLSAMAGWLHLLETGKLDEAGMKRAIEKLRGNIEDQVRTLDRYVGSRTHQGRP